MGHGRPMVDAISVARKVQEVGSADRVGGMLKFSEEASLPATNQAGEVERGTAFAKLNNWLDEHGYAGSLADLRAVRGDDL